MAFAIRIASSSVSKVWIVKTGPNISSFTIALCGSGLMKIVGFTKNPLSPFCSPPVTKVAVFFPIAIYDMTRSNWRWSTIGPSMVEGSRGLRPRSASAALNTFARAAQNSETMLFCTNMREVADV